MARTRRRPRPFSTAPAGADPRRRVVSAENGSSISAIGDYGGTVLVDAPVRVERFHIPVSVIERVHVIVLVIDDRPLEISHRSFEQRNLVLAEGIVEKEYGSVRRRIRHGIIVNDRDVGIFPVAL